MNTKRLPHSIHYMLNAYTVTYLCANVHFSLYMAYLCLSSTCKASWIPACAKTHTAKAQNQRVAKLSIAFILFILVIKSVRNNNSILIVDTTIFLG